MGDNKLMKNTGKYKERSYRCVQSNGYSGLCTEFWFYRHVQCNKYIQTNGYLRIYKKRVLYVWSLLYMENIKSLV